MWESQPAEGKVRQLAKIQESVCKSRHIRGTPCSAGSRGADRDHTYKMHGGMRHNDN